APRSSLGGGGVFQDQPARPGGRRRGAGGARFHARRGPAVPRFFNRPDRHVDCARSMGPIPFAFSVHHFINSVGADAGFASLIGLAILVLLYFSQARETAALREQA